MFTYAEVFTPHSINHCKHAFTLAEVLITLGIIGVVAALTLPSLINNYQKKETTTRLKHFRSVMSQGAQLRNKDIINGEFYELEPENLTPNNPDSMENFYNYYWSNYINTIQIKKTTKGIIAVLSNGSAMYMRKDGGCPNSLTGCLYITFCTREKYCERINETMAYATSSSDGKHTFIFWSGGQVPTDYNPKTRETLLNNCKNGNHYYCSSLIEYDGWEIKDDYPWQ